jgi:hypothetical protein
MNLQDRNTHVKLFETDSSTNVVVMIPADLQTLCLTDIDPKSEEGELLLPPPNICTQVVLAYETGTPTAELTQWVEQQQTAATRAAELVAQLPEYDGHELPGWVGTQWAIQLGCPWGAGLSDATQEAQQWLSSQ